LSYPFHLRRLVTKFCHYLEIGKNSGTGEQSWHGFIFLSRRHERDEVCTTRYWYGGMKILEWTETPWEAYRGDGVEQQVFLEGRAPIPSSGGPGFVGCTTWSGRNARFSARFVTWRPQPLNTRSHYQWICGQGQTPDLAVVTGSGGKGASKVASCELLHAQFNFMHRSAAEQSLFE
jgi:hypothetical protein